LRINELQQKALYHIFSISQALNRRKKNKRKAERACKNSPIDYNTCMSLIMAKNKVESEQLELVPTPEPTDTHTPIPHSLLADRTRDALGRAGFEITEEEHALGRGGLRYFGGFALKGEGIDGNDRKLVLGLRNAHDKSFAASVCIGNHMMVCENLCFSSDVKLARRHTVNILRDLNTVLSSAVSRVVSHWTDMGKRIDAYKGSELSKERASDLVVDLAEMGAFPAGVPQSPP
jgi:hypothetical protein